MLEVFGNVYGPVFVPVGTRFSERNYLRGSVGLSREGQLNNKTGRGRVVQRAGWLGLWRRGIRMRTARLGTLTAIVCLSLAGWLAVPAVAQDMAGEDVITAIRVDGLQRIDDETVISYIKIAPGDSFDTPRISEALKNLYATGFFADVNIVREDSTLVVQVVEHPITNRVSFEGNDHLDDDSLAAELTLRPRVLFTRTKAQKDTKRLLEIYRKSGRYAATVEPKVIQLSQNRVDLVFEIGEGPLTTVKRIAFVGDKALSDRVLRGVIRTKQDDSWCWAEKVRIYDPDRLTFDRELLRRFYLKEGYVDFRVDSVVAELLSDREGFIVTFTVEEGERQRFGKIDVATTLPRLDPEAMREHVLAKEGEWYNTELVEETINNLTEFVGDLGYAFVDIRPRIERDRENRLIHVTIEIQEGPKVFVERIDIRGNVRTLDRVIRREFRLVEDDPFNTAKLRRSHALVQNLGFFSRVDINVQPGSARDRVILNIEVEEKSTGGLGLGVEFSAKSGPRVKLSIEEKNVLGRGQSFIADVGLSVSGASSTEISFTEPYFLDRHLRAKWGLQFKTGSSDDWMTPVAGFQLTLWAGIFVFRMPLIVLIFLQGAYYSYLWSDDPSRSRKRYKKTIYIAKSIILLQASYFVLGHIVEYVARVNNELLEYTSDFVCG